MDEEMEEPKPTENRVVFIVPKQHVKTVKTALEEHGKLDRTAKIVPHSSPRTAETGNPSTENPVSHVEESFESGCEHSNVSQDSMHIPTTIPCHPWSEPDADGMMIRTMNLLGKIGLRYLYKDVSIAYRTIPKVTTPERNPLRKALKEVLGLLPESILTSLNLTPDRLVYAFPESYSIYTPLLLLPSNAFASPLWKALFTAHPVSAASLQPLWKHIASAMGVTHIAINSPIPLQSSTKDENILRSPVNITPIFGDFGPLPTPQTLSSPSREDFEKALWVEATQNGIRQTWAPLYTMFSRGNIREKTRILHFPNPSSAGAVADMYAGIGYFAFSYRSSNLFPILCFELNPWSVEGLRRGAAKNGWTCRVFTQEDMHEWDEEDVQEQGKDFYIFQMSNVNALPLLQHHLKILPPIRHVNLGLLPSSRDSWRDAVRLIDMVRGGCIHVHENVGVEEMENRRKEIRTVFQGFVDEVSGSGEEDGIRRKAEVEHVERVKMYAPDVVHCVFDVWIDGGRG